MIFRNLIAIGIGLSLSACLSVLPDPKPASTVYRLSTTLADNAPMETAQVIRVDRPTANQIYNTTDIVLSSDPQTLSVIAQANWAEAAPVMIQTALVDRLDASSRFVGIIPTSGARTDTRLHLTVSNFEASFDNGPESAPLGIVSYRVTYARADDRKLLGTYAVRKTARAESINVSSVVAAIDAANKAAMTDIVRWLETQQTPGMF